LFWNDVLNRFNGVSKTVQKQDVNRGVVVSLIQSLKLFTESLRNHAFESELKAQAIAKDLQYTDSCRLASKRSFPITFL